MECNTQATNAVGEIVKHDAQYHYSFTMKTYSIVPVTEGDTKSKLYIMKKKKKKIQNKGVKL
jgi:hypothetical protein